MKRFTQLSLLVIDTINSTINSTCTSINRIIITSTPNTRCCSGNIRYNFQVTISILNQQQIPQILQIIFSFNEIGELKPVEETGSGSVGSGADLEEELDGWEGGRGSVKDIYTIIKFSKRI